MIVGSYGCCVCNFFFYDGKSQMGEFFCLSFFVGEVYLLFYSFLRLVSYYYQQNGNVVGYVYIFFLIDGNFGKDVFFFFVCILVR